MKQEKLRKQVKILKAVQGISYGELSEYLEIKKQSFYNWLKGQYELSREKENRLCEIINDIAEEETILLFETR